MRYYLQSVEFKMAPVITRSRSCEERSRSRTNSGASHPEITDPENPQPDITLPKPLLVGEIIEHVLHYLNTQDLDSCLQAFDFWKKLIDEEKKRRRDVHPFLWGNPCKEHGKVDGCDLPPEEPRSIDHDISLKVKKFKSRRCAPFLFTTAYVMRNAEVLFPGIQKTVMTDDYLRFKDITDRKTLERSQADIVDNVEKKLRKLVVKALGRYFPASPQQAFFVTDYIIGCDGELNVTELWRHPAIAGFILPQYPGFEIHKFELRRSKMYEAFPFDLNIKGLLVFSVNVFTFDRVMDFIHTKAIYDIAFGGHEDSENNLPPYGTVVAFCGENVETASLAVSPYDERAERKLKLFGETGLLENTCFAFAFISLIEDKEIRLKLVKTFKELYPTIPISGVINKEVYGVDYLPGVSEEIKTLFLDQLLCKDRIEFLYEDRTVFVLVSIKP